MDNITIRNATPDDFAGIIKLIAANSDQLEPRTSEQLQAALGTMWVADLGGEIVGSAILDIYSERMAEIRSVAVRSDVRRQGVAQALVNRAAQEARSRNIKEVFALTGSPDIFERLGFSMSTRSKFAMFLKK